MAIMGIFILISNLISYANSPGITTASFLKIGAGARAAGMGEVFAATVADGSSLYWNSAGLIRMRQRQLSASYNLWFQEIKQSYISFGFPSLRGTVALGVNYVDIGDIEGRDEEGDSTGDFGPSDLYLSIGYVKRFKKIALGFTIRWLQDKIKDDTENAFLGNIGLLYPLGEQLTLGTVIQNVGSQLGQDPLPLTLKMGIALNREALTLATDVAKPKDNDVYWCVGAEW